MATYTQLDLFEHTYPAAPGWDALYWRESIQPYAKRLAALAAVVITALAAAWDRLLWPLAKAGATRLIRWAQRELAAQLAPAATACPPRTQPRVEAPCPAPSEAFSDLPEAHRVRTALEKLSYPELKAAAGKRGNVKKADLIHLILKERGLA